MRRKGRLEMRHVALALLLTLAIGCRTALPSRNEYPVAQIADPTLQTNANLCQKHMNELRDDASKAGDFSDAMTVIGGVLGAGGSITAATFQAVEPGSQGATITAAGIAGAGGLLAIISKLVDSPTTSLNKHALASTHWFAAQQLLTDPTITASGANAAAYQKINTELVSCQNDQNN